MAHSDNFTNQYFWGSTGVSPNLLGVDVSKKQPELTKEEKLKRVEDYIAKYNVEHDENYIYLYKAVNLDGTNIHQSGNKIIYEEGKVYTEKCDQDINKECSNGLHAGTYSVALEFGKGNSGNLWSYTTTPPSWMQSLHTLTLVINANKNQKFMPANPSDILKESKFRLFKVKIYKEHVVVPNSTEGKIRCNQMEIIEEVKLENILKFTLISIEEKLENNNYIFTFDVINDLNNKNLKVQIVSDTLDNTQNEINNKIKARIDQMQNIYDKFQELSKFDGSILA